MASILDQAVLDGGSSSRSRASSVAEPILHHNLHNLNNTNNNSITNNTSAFATISPGSPHYQGSPHTAFPYLLYTINEFPPDPSSSSVASPASSSFAATPPSYSPLGSTPPLTLEQHQEAGQPKVNLSSSSSFTSSFFDPNVHRYESSFSQFAVCSNNLFALGDANGHVGLWSVKRDIATHWCCKFIIFYTSYIFLT